jgi:hypothetical protein
MSFLFAPAAPPPLKSFERTVFERLNPPRYVQLRGGGFGIFCARRYAAGAYLFRLPVDLVGYAKTNNEFLPSSGVRANGDAKGGVEGVLPECFVFPVEFANEDACRIADINLRHADDIKILERERDEALAQPGADVNAVMEKFDDDQAELIKNHEARIRDLEKDPNPVDPVSWGFHCDRRAADGRRRATKLDGQSPVDDDGPELSFIDARWLRDVYEDLTPQEDFGDYKKRMPTVEIEPALYSVILGEEKRISKSDFTILRGWGHVCYVRGVAAVDFEADRHHQLSLKQPKAFYVKMQEYLGRQAATRQDRVQYDAEWAALAPAFAGIEILEQEVEEADEDVEGNAKGFDEVYNDFMDFLRQRRLA